MPRCPESTSVLRRDSGRARHAFALLLAVIVPAAASAQGFHGIHSRDGTDVWAVGDGGVVYRSVDGGLQWTASSLGTKTLRAVGAVDQRVIVVGDSGSVWRSADLGLAWVSTTAPGAPRLRALAMVTALVAYAVGDAGAILRTEDGGASWTAQTSGTSSSLNAVAFDGAEGWAVGAGGTVLHTVDAGALWVPVAAGVTQELFSVDCSGGEVWVVGADGVARRSGTGGGSWQPIDLGIDSRADVRVVRLESGAVWLAGGGGFIRRSTDGGATWDFPPHPMHGRISGFVVAGGRAFACSDRHRVPIASQDGGATWAMPGGAALARTWSLRQQPPGPLRGNNFQMHPANRDVVFCVLGNIIYRSPDAGETWAEVATIPNAFKASSFLISPKDTNVFLAATGEPKRIDRSADYGQTWVTTLTHAYGDYGVPLEMHPDRPDTVYFGGDGSPLWRSTDFGATWSTLSSNVFRSPCDIVVIPGHPETIVLGDGVTGAVDPPNFFKSVNGGQDFDTTLSPVGPSEAPGLAASRLRPATVFGSTWGSGGIKRSTDFGSTWTDVHPAGSAWGIGIAADDPNCVIFGVFSGAMSYVSLDGGTTYTNHQLPSSNYGFFVRDRETFLAQQTGGIYKLRFTYSYAPTNAQAIDVTSPDGGESWLAGTARTITWNASNVAVARVQYRSGPGPWTTLADVPGYYGSLAWTVPCPAADEARVRVVDAFDGLPDDSSGADFAVLAAQIAAGPVDFGAVVVDSSVVRTVTLSNAGDGDLSVSAVAVAGGGPFTTARTTAIVPGFASDTLGVRFSPQALGTFLDTLVVASNACNEPAMKIALRGVAVAPGLGTGDSVDAFAVWQNRPNPFRGTTEIEYALATAADVRLDVFDLQGHLVATLDRGRKGPGRFRVAFGPGAVTASGGRVGSIPSGVYFYRLRAGGEEASRKMLFLE